MTQTVTSLLETIENPQRQTDARTLLALMKSLTHKKPVLWGPSIIGFGTHHYIYETGREGDTVAVGFAPRKTALVLYGVVHYESGRSRLKDLGPVKAGKGCLYIKKLDDVDRDVLSEMISVSFDERNNAS